MIPQGYSTILLHWVCHPWENALPKAMLRNASYAAQECLLGMKAMSKNKGNGITTGSQALQTRLPKPTQAAPRATPQPRLNMMQAAALTASQSVAEEAIQPPPLLAYTGPRATPTTQKHNCSN